MAYSYNFLGGMSFNVQTIADNIFTTGFPHEIILEPAGVLSTEVINLQAADTITNFRIMWMEWQALA